MSVCFLFQISPPPSPFEFISMGLSLNKSRKKSQHTRVSTFIIGAYKVTTVCACVCCDACTSADTEGEWVLINPTPSPSLVNVNLTGLSHAPQRDSFDTETTGSYT